MAYSRSEYTLKKILPELHDLEAGRAHKWDTEPGRAWWFATKVREALYIAREVFPGRYPKLAFAAAYYVVEVLDDHTVQARPASIEQPLRVEADEALPTSENRGPGVTPIHGLELVGSVPRTISGQRTATDIISWCLRAGPTNDKLVFTEADLSDAELDQLARWAATRTPRWMVVANRPEKIVTLSPWQPGVPAWRVT